jgi:uncharacterized protein
MIIVDCHTHIWQSPEQLGLLALGRPGRTPSSPTSRVSASIIPGDPEYHAQKTAGLSAVFVLGFQSEFTRTRVSNNALADYVSRNPEKYIGFAGIDPASPDAIDDLHKAKNDLRLKGITLCPSCQNIHPVDMRAMRVYEQADKLKMPLLFHYGAPLPQNAPLEYANPLPLDEVARSFPKLKIIIAGMGFPFPDITVSLLEKHPNVFADTSGLFGNSMAAYNVLSQAYNAGAIDKILFGSDFPYAEPNDCVEFLYRLNSFALTANLPAIPRESLREIIERDAIALLGLK